MDIVSASLALSPCLISCRVEPLRLADPFFQVFDFVQHTLGEALDLQGRLQLQRQSVKVRDPAADNAIVETVTSDVPDLIVATATLQESATVQGGATLLIRFRRGQPFPGEPALVWTVNGEKGEIRIVSRGGTALHANAYEDEVTFERHDFETQATETVEWGWEPWQEELPAVARSVGALYEALAEGDEAQYPTFEDALRRHEQLEGMLSAWDDAQHA